MKALVQRLGYANTVTLVRIVCIPVFLVVWLADWPAWFGIRTVLYQARPWLALLLFVLLAVTDLLDGYLARSRGEVSPLGAFIDPLADKLLVTAALLALIQIGLLPAWVAFVIIAREFVVSGLRMVAAEQQVVIAASMYGKVKTVLQIAAIVLFIPMGSLWYLRLSLSLQDLYYTGAWIVMWAAVVMTIVSMLEYFANAIKVMEVPWKRTANYTQK
ncbi:MAG: CDP-diacylglycerol--glycerol-3-phosphate 3-phosphatidyltransferase [Coriobacteriia bacterium]|nr:CDP-diacylglycerol--glycerol-3-phosphate 3-phosphatidyltransferase [Coriobacteriia bacterium]